MAETWWQAMRVLNLQPGADESVMDVFNAVGSGQVIRMYRIAVHFSHTSGTGVNASFSIYRTTRADGGGVVQPIGQRVADAAWPAGVSCGIRRGTSPTDLFRSITHPQSLVSLNQDRPQASMEAVPELFLAPETGPVEPLVARPGEGIELRTGSVAHTFLGTIIMDFTTASS